MKKENELRIQVVNSMLSQVKFNAKSFAIKLVLLSYVFFNEVNALFIYPGSKRKMKNELNDIFDEMYLDKYIKTKKGFNMFIDAFGGAGNSTLALMESLQINGCEKFIINEIDTCVYTTHLNCKNNSKELIEAFCEIIRTKFILPYGTLFLNRTTYEKITKELIEEFEILQLNKDFGIMTSIRFILLRGLEYSGVLKYHKDGSGHKFSGKIYDRKKIFSWIFNQIPKIEKFSKIYNDLDIEFINKDCFDLFKEDRIKNNKSCLINLDPPYVQELKDKIPRSTLLSMTDDDLKDCIIDYDIKFPHIKLLKMLKLFKSLNISYIYNNNSHPLIKMYAHESYSKIQEFIRNENITAVNSKKTKVVMEYIVYKVN